MSRGMKSFRAMYMDTSPNSWLVEIDDYYLQSSVSYYGLNAYVDHCSRASMIIKGRSFDTSEYSQSRLESLAESCRLLYGLLHQRFISTEDGTRKLFEKYQRGIYGRCPRTACKNKHLIPMGFDIEPNKGKVKLWCPQCHDIYNPPSHIHIDGAFFGPDLPIMFHKIMEIPLKYKAFSTYLNQRRDSQGNIVPAIKQRLYRWGEQNPKKDDENAE